MSEAWTQLSGRELAAHGRLYVSGRLERAGAQVTFPRRADDGRLEVMTATGRRLEVFTSTQRIGGYSMWLKRRLRPSPERLAAIVLVDADEVTAYLIPSLTWLRPSAPFTAPDYEGRKSEPEYGVRLGVSAIDELRRYAWTADAEARLLA